MIDGIKPTNWPCNIDAETQVLSVMIRDPATIDQLASILSPEHFFTGIHEALYRAMLDMSRAGVPIGFAPLVENLPKFVRQGPNCPTIDDIRKLFEYSDSIDEALYNAQVILKLAKHRQLMVAAAEFRKAISEADSDDVVSVVLEFEQRLASIRSQGIPLQTKTLAEHTAAAVDSAWRVATEGEVVGLPTAWPELDRLIGGLKPGRLLVVAGRPGNGKSSLALNVATHVAREAGQGTFFVSLEMTGEELGTRQAASDTGVPIGQILDSPETMVDGQWTTLRKAASSLQGLPIWIDETGCKTVEQIADEARIHVRQRNCGLIIVDHIGLISVGPAQRGLTRQQQIGHFTRQLKQLAKALQVPILALSQLNREVEKQAGRRPQLADLRESGDVEQDADVVMMIHREDPDGSNEAEIIVRKARMGRRGTAYLDFVPSTTTFRSRTSPPNGTY